MSTKSALRADLDAEDRKTLARQRQPKLQVGGVAYRCPIEFRHQVARLEPGTLGRRLRIDLEEDCSGRSNPLDAGSPASPVASAAASCGAFLAARSASLRAASCCLACSSSVTASVPISVLSPMPRPPAVDRLGLTNNPRIKHCRASHLAACGHMVLPKIGPVIALRRRTDYQFSPNWLSGAEDELSQPRFSRPVGRRKSNMSLSDPRMWWSRG